MGCASLANAVILRAIYDLFCAAGDYQSGSPTRIEKMEAIRFLTDETGPHAASRERWCASADRDPDSLRAVVVAFLNGDEALTAFAPPARGSRAQAHLDQAIAEARALYVEMLDLDGRALAGWRKAAEQRAQQSRMRKAREAAKQARNGRSPEALVMKALGDGPKTAREIGFFLDGALDATAIYAVLNDLVARGQVAKDGSAFAAASNELSQTVV